MDEKKEVQKIKSEATKYGYQLPKKMPLYLFIKIIVVEGYFVEEIGQCFPLSSLSTSNTFISNSIEL